MTHHIDLNTIRLAKGGHNSRGEELCLMEVVAWWAGEDHTDKPGCVSPVLRDFGISLNDRLPDDKRQQLVPLIPELAGTAGDGLDKQRGYLAWDWLIRVYVPAWLDLAGLKVEAATLRGLPPVVDLATARAAGLVMRDARDKSDAAWAAARAAAWAAAWDIAWAAARAALQTTVDLVHDSAINLYTRMVEPHG